MSEKQEPRQPDVVLEVGSVWTRAGYAGEAVPRAVVPTPPLLAAETTAVRLRGRVAAHLKRIFLERLQADPTRSSVVVVESVLAPRELRIAVAAALLLTLHAPAVSFAPAELCAAVAAGACSGPVLVVDAGWGHTDVVPVCDGGSLVVAALRASHTGAGVAAQEIWRCAKWSSRMPPTLDLHLSLADTLLRTLPSPRFIASGDGSFTADLPEGARTAALRRVAGGDSGHLDRQQQLENDDVDATVPVADVIVDSLLHCPTDLRRAFARNILRMGGMWMVPGFDKAVLEALVTALEKSPLAALSSERQIAFLALPFAAAHLGWTGASAMAFAADPRLCRITPKASGFVLPDWTSITSLHPHSRQQPQQQQQQQQQQQRH